jgi:hypothetical protein
MPMQTVAKIHYFERPGLTISRLVSKPGGDQPEWVYRRQEIRLLDTHNRVIQVKGDDIIKVRLSDLLSAYSAIKSNSTHLRINQTQSRSQVAKRLSRLESVR